MLLKERFGVIENHIPKREYRLKNETQEAEDNESKGKDNTSTSCSRSMSWIVLPALSTSANARTKVKVGGGEWGRDNMKGAKSQRRGENNMEESQEAREVLSWITRHRVTSRKEPTQRSETRELLRGKSSEETNVLGNASAFSVLVST